MGHPSVLERFGGSESDPAGLWVWMTPQPPCPPVPINWLSLFFSLPPLWRAGLILRPNHIFRTCLARILIDWMPIVGANFQMVWALHRRWTTVGVTGRPNLSTPPDTRRRLVKGLWGCSVIPSYKLHKCATVQVWSCTGYIDALMVVM